jgi:hypothetical protein
MKNIGQVGDWTRNDGKDKQKFWKELKWNIRKKKKWKSLAKSGIEPRTMARTNEILKKSKKRKSLDRVPKSHYLPKFLSTWGLYFNANPDFFQQSWEIVVEISGN